MGNELLASKIIIVEEEPRIRNIPGVSVAVTGFVGVTERGPFGATLINSWEEYVKNFGGYTTNSDVAPAVEEYFRLGGQTAYVSRTVHYTTISNASTKTSAAATVTLVDRAVTPLNTIRVDGKTDGTYANSLKIKIESGTSGVATDFNFVVLNSSNQELERFSNLNMTATSVRYFATIINDANLGSDLVKVTDLFSATASPSNQPAIATSALMTGGNDGLTSIADTDFIGDPTSLTGMHGFDQQNNITLLGIPGRSSSAAVAAAMTTYCEVTRSKSMFPVFDPPASQTTAQIQTYVGTLTSSEFGALYWPRVTILNPSTTVYGSSPTITIPPSGPVLGAYARTANSKPGGIYQAPAGIEAGLLPGVLGVEMPEVNNEAKRDMIYPVSVNPIVQTSGVGVYIDGARTLKLSGNFPTIPERLGATFIEQSIKTGLLFAKFKPNTASLRAEVRRSITAFLQLQLLRGAFASDDPTKAFFVDVSDALNPPAVVAAGQLVCRIGIAMAKPAEFIELRFTSDTAAISRDRLS